jgi:hypothetical protein
MKSPSLRPAWATWRDPISTKQKILNKKTTTKEAYVIKSWGN